MRRSNEENQGIMKKIKTVFRDVKRILKKRKKYIIFLFLIVFPLIIGWIYSWPLPQIIAVGPGELLAFYGTAFGLFFSFSTYLSGKEKEKRERNRELRPRIMVDLKKSDDKDNLFLLTITDNSLNPISYIYLFDEFLTLTCNPEIPYKVTFNISKEEYNKIKPDANIILDDEDIDENGFPKYIQILCDDIDSNIWNCLFNIKTKDSAVYYAPIDFYIV